MRSESGKTCPRGTGSGAQHCGKGLTYVMGRKPQPCEGAPRLCPFPREGAEAQIGENQYGQDPTTRKRWTQTWPKTKLSVL